MSRERHNKAPLKSGWADLERRLAAVNPQKHARVSQSLMKLVDIEEHIAAADVVFASTLHRLLQSLKHPTRR